ncbi:hypothetical protein NOF55_16800 [Rhizobiaceae bacterium BDR2-2]|uniref:Oligosaccharyl transferase-like protein n=1 Tax=Ectorhizobium quercum TaxID=2965071 RepID=A0AAE3N314_9HYPH|nr:hypothetical protein [Ectorhizobium quercum]MCX8996187.1 hypothetical protein [Ectorhizobium quercum]MCX8998774.1 hypothetical protein [Ectorhizobium quercum]
MTNAFHLPAGTRRVDSLIAGEDRLWWSRLSLMTVLFSLAAISTVLLLTVPGATDYVGADNDDVMRLVVVRDLLAGQGWFDAMQYRLGLAGGTLMHWSRLIDAPIAGLILFFGLFLDGTAAEAAALAVWPLALVPPLIGCVGLGARRLGGAGAMNVAMSFTVILVVTSNRFLPGSIDHHNLQLVLIAGLAAVLLDRRYGAVNYAVGGVLAALALAIGAETTPLLAVICLAVTGLWLVHGKAFERAASAFGLSLALSVTVLFLATVPPSRYAVVTCDSLSLGFYGLSALGGALMFVSARHASGWNIRRRLAVVGANGAIVLLAALALAPQCLGSPLADLDPLLVSLWLNKVTEAQSFLATIRSEPATAGGFYAVGFFGMAVALSRVLLGDRVEGHAILFALILAAWAVALVQVRGAIFSNLLVILPLSLLVAELRRLSNAEPENMAAGFFFLTATLASVPAVWVFGGALPSEGINGIVQRFRAPVVAPAVAGAEAGAWRCNGEDALSGLAALPPGVVAAPSNLGASILRFSGHRVLTAPYHRNQPGMLTELHIGLAIPREAEAFLRGAGVTVVAFCADDPQTRQIAALKPDGLYAGLAAGRVPAYLEPLPTTAGAGLQLFRVRP